MAGQYRQKQACCEHHHPWQYKPPLIRSTKCLPSDLQEPHPAKQQKALSAAKSKTTFVCWQDNEQGFDLIKKCGSNWSNTGQRGTAPVIQRCFLFDSKPVQTLTQLFSTATILFSGQEKLFFLLSLVTFLEWIWFVIISMKLRIQNNYIRLSQQSPKCGSLRTQNVI